MSDGVLRYRESEVKQFVNERERLFGLKWKCFDPETYSITLLETTWGRSLPGKPPPRSFRPEMRLFLPQTLSFRPEPPLFTPLLYQKIGALSYPCTETPV
jgi:hypothetical protein